ncbi:MAG: hypothetical protein AAF462_03375 [Thermodesulfobacteriota bacterium]
MIKSLPDIESYDHIVKRLFKEIEQIDAESFNLYSYAAKLGLGQKEMETLYYHLKRGEIIENVSEREVRISKYGHMMYNGQINNGYVPI